MWCLKVSFYASNVKMKGFQNVLSQAIVPCCGFERSGEKKKVKKKKKSPTIFSLYSVPPTLDCKLVHCECVNPLCPLS